MSALPDPDLQDRLDRAIGAAPPSPATADPRVLGHRALRRRRAVVGAAVAAVVLVGGGTATAVLGEGFGGGGGGRAVEVAVEPTMSAAPSPSAAPIPSDASQIPTVRVEPMDPATADPGDAARTRLTEDTWATFATDGDLELVPDATIVQRIDDPIPSDDQSVALELSRPGRPAAWYLVEFIPGYYPLPTTTTVTAGSGGAASLADWVATLSDPVEPLDQGYGEPVTRAADGTLTASRGVRILAQQAGFDVGVSFAPAADTSAALVERDGIRLFLLVRTVAGRTETTTVPQPVVRATDLAGFRTWATHKIADGWAR